MLGIKSLSETTNSTAAAIPKTFVEKVEELLLRIIIFLALFMVLAALIWCVVAFCYILKELL